MIGLLVSNLELPVEEIRGLVQHKPNLRSFLHHLLLEPTPGQDKLHVGAAGAESGRESQKLQWQFLGFEELQVAVIFLREPESGERTRV